MTGGSYQTECDDCESKIKASARYCPDCGEQQEWFSDDRLEEYVDIRGIHPGYTTIPCKECEGDFYVQNSFAFNHDTWYCDDCKPEELKQLSTGPDVTVRI
ncbi:hypothetical protein [Natrinema sp. H-ect4]|uniref:hypothetical protein n=1 Tax=Natrinema sp. H-ect4 TaxID=3242699 RepID=UPI0035A944BB